MLTRLWGKLSISQSAGTEDRTQAALLSPSLLDAETMSLLLSFLLLSRGQQACCALRYPRQKAWLRPSEEPRLPQSFSGTSGLRSPQRPPLCSRVTPGSSLPLSQGLPAPNQGRDSCQDCPRRSAQLAWMESGTAWIGGSLQGDTEARARVS